MDFEDNGRDDIFSQSHHVFKIPVCPVDLHHGELRIVIGVHCLVPEVAGYLKNFLKSPDDQPLKVEFGCDPQEEFLVKEVVVRGKRAGICSTVNRLQDRGFELEKAVVIEIPSDEGDDPAPVPEYFPALVIHNQINVALAITLFDVGQAVEFLRERAYSLAQESECVHPDGDLTQFRPEHMTRDPDDVSPLDELVEEIELLIPKIVFTNIQLYLSRLITKVSKHGLPVVPDNIDPSGRRYPFRTLVVSDISVLRFDIENRVLPVKR